MDVQSTDVWSAAVVLIQNMGEMDGDGLRGGSSKNGVIS